MPLSGDNYRNFYFGNSAEFFMMSEIYSHGFEAHKYNPDIGFDILVTNKALSTFNNAEEKCFNIQVKSSFMIKDRVLFFLKKNEVEFLAEHENMVCVFCVFKPVFKGDPQSFVDLKYSEQPWWENLMASYCEHLATESFWKIKNDGEVDSLEIKRFDIEYFWLNRAQLKKALSEKLIFDSSQRKEICLIDLRKDNHSGALSFYGAKEKYIGSPVPEIFNIKYLLKDCESSGYLSSGDFLYEHI